MTLFSPLTIKSILLISGAGALAYCIAKIQQLYSAIKNLQSDYDTTNNNLLITRNLSRSTDEQLDHAKILIAENKYRIEKLNEQLNVIENEQATHKNHIDKLKELQDAKPVENKKKNS